jgi:hypothetical protein
MISACFRLALPGSLPHRSITFRGTPPVKVFISWSGDSSRAFAEALKPWLEQVLPGTEVWLSSEDIDKGTIWFTQIIAQLEDCSCGVVCVTRENRASPWIHFEAGGMIKGLGKSRVATVLLDLAYGELAQPLNQFNGLRMDRAGARHLIKSFNKVSEKPLQERIVERLFDTFWKELEEAFHRIFPEQASHPEDRAESVFVAPTPNRHVREARRTKDSAQAGAEVEYLPVRGQIGPDGQLYLFE